MDKTVGHAATMMLIQVTAMKWMPEAVERVSLWAPVIAKAYDAYAEGFPERIVHIPSHIGGTGGKDVTARELLENFNIWLGRGVVWHAFDAASGWGDDDL